MSDTSYETDRIEQDLDHTRARLDATIGALQDKLSPGQILDQGLAYLRESGGGEFARNLTHNVTANPMPVALVATGLAWLMMGNAREAPPAGASGHCDDQTSMGPSLYERAKAAASSVHRTADETAEAFQDRVHQARAAAVGVSRQAGETAQAFAERVEQAVQMAQRGAGAMAHGVGSMAGGAASAARGMQEGGSRAFAYLQDQPLLLGALGISVGALLAAVVPVSEKEQQLLGGVGDNLREQVKDAAGAAMEEGKRVAGEVMQAAGDAADRAGLGPDELQRRMEAGAVGLGEMAERTRQVVEDTAAAGREAIGGTEGRRSGVMPPRTGVDESGAGTTGELPRADRIGLDRGPTTLPS